MTFQPSIHWSTSPQWTWELTQTQIGRVAVASHASPLLQKLRERIDAFHENNTSDAQAATSFAEASWPPLDTHELPTSWMTDRGEPPSSGTLAPQFQHLLGEVEIELNNRLFLLKQQWQARSPGIWSWLARRPGLAECLQASLFIATTLPLFGGQAWHLRNRPGAVVEAVLFDPVPRLPEVLRILQALLQSQLDQHFGNQQPDIHFQISSILALAAGEQVELTTLESTTWELVLEHWTGPNQMLLTQSPEVADMSVPTFDEIDPWLVSKIKA